MAPDTAADLTAARRLLARVLPTADSLQAFCTRNFPALATSSVGSEGSAQLIERLLSRASVAEVRYRLALEHPEAVAQHADYALRLNEAAGRPLPLRSLPQPRDPRFTGRAVQLGTLRGLLSRHQLVAITGPSGAGKTALALELAHRWSDQYQVVYAVGAAAAGELRTGLAALARRLGEQGLVTLPCGAAEELACAAVRDYCNRHSDWLLVVDDVRDPRALTTLLPPSVAAGHLLLTCPAPMLPEAACFALGPLDEAEALQLLAVRSNRHQLQPGERAAVKRLARALAYWPGALCSVADAVRQRGCTWSEAAGAAVACPGCGDGALV